MLGIVVFSRHQPQMKRLPGGLNSTQLVAQMLPIAFHMFQALCEANFKMESCDSRSGHDSMGERPPNVALLKPM